MPLTCSICATASPDDARFCRGCGAALTGTTVAPSAAAVTAVPCAVCRHPNGSGTRFCAKCGTDQFAAPVTPSAAVKAVTATLPTPPAAAAPAAPRSMRWLASGALAFVLAAAAWWLLAPQRGSPSSTPDTAASAAPVAAPLPPPAPPDAASAIGSTPTPPLTPAELWDPIPPDELQAARDQAAKLRVAREAKALAAREQAALAEQDAARQRSDDTGARLPAPAPPAAGPAPRSATPAPAAATPAAAGTVQQACGNRNAISQAICESRECSRSEHANEATCKRVRAAEERRRQPE